MLPKCLHEILRFAFFSVVIIDCCTEDSLFTCDPSSLGLYALIYIHKHCQFIKEKLLPYTFLYLLYIYFIF